MNGCRLIHRQDPERLIAPFPPLDKRDDARALQDGLVSVTPQAGDVQQHVLHAVVGNDEAEPLGHVEPFYDTGNLNQIDRLASEILDLVNTFR